MSKERLKLQAKRFVGDTGPAKLVSAVAFLLENTSYGIDVEAIDQKQFERLCAEFEDVKLMGRVRLKAEKGKVCQKTEQSA